METTSIVFLFLISAIFAVYPDVKKQINFYNLFMAITCFLMEPKSEEDIIKEEETSSQKPYIPFENKYIEKFRNLDEVDVNMESLKHTMVVDYTPYGNVAMMYNKEKEVFVYYTDHTMPYRFLEAVAQKFAIQFNAKKLVIDTEKEIEKLKEEIKTSETNTKESENKIEDNKTNEPDSEKKSVFAKFKTYNKMTTPGVGANVREVPSSTKSKEPELLLEKTNTYSCEGKFSHMTILQAVTPETFETRRKMTFADFKNLVTN
jgi:hypothetical protein